MTPATPDATPAPITVTADSLRAMFLALAAELVPPDPDTTVRGAYEAWQQEILYRRAGVLAELRILADDCRFPSIFQEAVSSITKLTTGREPVPYAVKEAGE